MLRTVARSYPPGMDQWGRGQSGTSPRVACVIRLWRARILWAPDQLDGRRDRPVGTMARGSKYPRGGEYQATPALIPQGGPPALPRWRSARLSQQSQWPVMAPPDCLTRKTVRSSIWSEQVNNSPFSLAFAAGGADVSDGGLATRGSRGEVTGSLHGQTIPLRDSVPSAGSRAAARASASSSDARMAPSSCGMWCETSPVTL